MHLLARALLLSGLLAAALRAQQGSLSLALAAPHPGTFSSGPAGTMANLQNVLRTEPLQVTLVTTPTPPPFPPAQLLPRRILLALGVDDPTPTLYPEGPLFLDPSASIPIIVLIDGFANPFAPTFGPPLQGPTNTLQFTIGADLFGPLFALPTPILALQALAEDTAGFPPLLSNAVRFRLVDPEAEGFVLQVLDLGPKAPTPLGNLRPQGPETGGNVLLISGQNFPAPTDWIRFPPTVRFGAVAAPLVAVLGQTSLACIAPPTLFPTNPPLTAACLVGVTVQNHPQIAPSAQAVPAPIPYLYTSGFVPVAAGFSQPNGLPEGGEIRLLQGSAFLDGAQLRISSVAQPTLSILVPATVGPGGTTAQFTTPPFCTGPVTVRLENCDEAFSNSVVFTYDPYPPVPTALAPSTTLPPALGGQSFAVVSETGTPLTIQGTGFLAPTSPLGTSPTVPPGSFHPTRVSIDGVLEPGLIASGSTLIAGVTRSFDETGLDRPSLGLKTVRLENPPCVNVGNAAPLPNPPCPPLDPSCTVLRQDASPPGALSIHPAIASTAGCRGLRLTGTNFFSRVPGVREQDFTPFAGPGGAITTLPPEALQVPAVFVGDRFATRVRLVSQTELLVDVPPVSSPVNLSVAITVYNPDLRASLATLPFRYVPPLSDPTALLEPALPDLDTNTLLLLAAGMPLPSAGPPDHPAMQFVVNPAPASDRATDPHRGSIPSSASYDFVLLLNTRAPGPSPAGPRIFPFRSIDLPALLVLPAPGMARALPLDPLDPAPGPLVPMPAGVALRLIVKATGFRLDAQGRVHYEATENHALVLQAHESIRLDALLHLGGDAFLVERHLLPAVVGGPFRVRVDRTVPPAGGGRGGRGGAWFPEGLIQLPGPNFGLSPTILAGGPGEPPAGRLAPPLLALVTQGRGGLGTAPVGVQAGGGGGAGHAAAGGVGQSGTSSGGLGGQPVGNVSTFAPFAPTGLPSDDRLIFGGLATDFLQFQSPLPLQSGLIYGGSGGGGGGGGLALFVPAITLGGRGGNGGGCLLLLAGCTITLGPSAALLAYGESGFLGVDVFPVYNSDPVIPVNIPGAGGGGSGGTILAFAVAEICSALAPSSCPILLGGAPLGPAVSARPGLGGPPVGTIAPSLTGGTGSAGRIRFAVNAFSPHATSLSTSLMSLWQNQQVSPAPPSLATLPTAFFTYPSL